MSHCLDCNSSVFEQLDSLYTGAPSTDELKSIAGNNATYSRGCIRPCSRRCRRRRRYHRRRRRRLLSSSFSALASSLPMFSTIPNPNQSRNPHSDRACTAATEVWQRCRALASVSVLASYSGGLRPSLPRLCLPARG